jgi:hypothetical protein
MFSVRRRKGFFTIILLLFCLVYFNWFVNISDWSRQSNDIIRDSVVKFVNNNENNLIIYEIIEGYDDQNFDYNNDNFKNNTTKKKYFNMNNNKNFYLLSARNSINNIKENKLNNWSNQLDNELSLEKNEITDLLRLLYRFQVFLLDVDLIKAIKFMQNTNGLDDSDKYSSSYENLDNKIDSPNKYKSHIKNFEKLNQILNNKKSNSIGFGIFLKSFNHLNNVDIFLL